MKEIFSVGQTFKGRVNGVVFRLKKETKEGFWCEFLNIEHKDVFVYKTVLKHLLMDAVY